MMKEKNISVFVDESGSFDSAKSPSRYYVVTLVIHETDSSIGQQQVKDLLKDAFAVLSSKAKFVPDVHPSDYRLFQAADFICTLALIRTKLENERHLSKSEISFFNSIQNLKKHFLKPIARKMLL